MPKTAEEWKIILELDDLPDSEFLESLNSLEDQDTIHGGGLEEKGLVAGQVNYSELLTTLIVENAGEAFKLIRQGKQLTVRQAAELWGISAGRVSQIESPEANLYMSTIGHAATRMGYKATLILEPINGGNTIIAKLDN